MRRTLAMVAGVMLVLVHLVPVMESRPLPSPQKAKKSTLRRVAAQKGKSSRSSRRSARPRRVRRVAIVPGARIPRERVLEIQNALIARGYLEGPPSGVYDAETVSAMKRFQQAENLDVTGYPTAHALRRLGLSPGPNGSASAADSGEVIPTRPPGNGRVRTP
jgi:peptidoglycan hydrolase-like protein with peptidoglycan-binding domain